MATWSMAEAEKNFDELLDRAVSEGLQYITRDGAQMAVVVSKEYWDSLGSSESVPTVDPESDPE
jgi:prevent-host-death family protein